MTSRGIGMKPCPKCGFVLFDLAQRCSNCGVKDPHNIGYNFDKKPKLVTVPLSKIKEAMKKAPPKRTGRGRIGIRNPKTQQLIPQALELRKQGGSIRQISKEIGLAKHTVESILPPFDKHITPKARNVLDKCLAHSLELFTKGYHNNQSDMRDNQDAFIETQCEFINPTELKNQMSAWTRQLIPVGDNAFVRGAIYALNKARDYFNSVKELEPPDNLDNQ